MCGICGYVNLNGAPVATTQLEAMTRAIAHRGPDDWGVWAEGHVGLGNTRLAIIDLSAAGHQPLCNEDGQVWIAFNGEIYNYLPLRQGALDRGHRFRSRTDTETITHLFEESGIECLRQLRGMFALALWDARHQTLWLARDRLGKKPLYYYRDATRFIFGSEIKSILAAGDVPRQLNREVLPLYLSYGYVPAPETIFVGVRSVMPGSWLRLSADGNGPVVIHEEAYWSPPLPTQTASTRSEASWSNELVEQLREAVRLRLISDVPLGAFLSGGLDSSVVVALMAEAVGKVKTFAIGFAGEPSYDETAHARVVAQHFDTDHHEYVVEPDAVALISKLAWHCDQPFGDSSAIPTYLVSKLAREHVTVALNGDGGDELFAGYERFRAARLAQWYGNAPSVAHSALEAIARRLPQGTGYRDAGRRLMRFVTAARQPLPQQYLRWVGIMSPELIGQLLPSDSALPAAHFANYFRLHNGRDPLPALLDVNLRTYLPDDLLVKADRMSMAASLEARSPFLDHVLVEFAAAMPASLKLRGNVSKYILKRAFEGKLPRAIIHRRKHGFGVPLGKWFRTSLRDYLADTLLSARASERGLWQAPAVAQLAGEHWSGERDHGHALWTLLMLEEWHRTFLDATPR